MEMVNVNKNSSADVMKSVEDVTDRAVNAQAEKNLFLGEYKERVIKALTFEEIKEKGIYYEIEKALEDKDVDKMVISRHADFNDIKKYIEIANNRVIASTSTSFSQAEQYSNLTSLLTLCFGIESLKMGEKQLKVKTNSYYRNKLNSTIDVLALMCGIDN